MHPSAHAPAARRDHDDIPGPRRRAEDRIDMLDRVELALGPSARDSVADPGSRPSEFAPSERDSLGVYLGEIRGVRLLTAEEEVVLAKAIELGRQIVATPERAIFSLWD